MAEIFNLSAICRCCHTDGSFKSLNLCYSFMGQTELYANMMHETFGLTFIQPSIEASNSICDTCIEKLRNALQFKKQVQECEMKFADYCKNEIALEIETELSNKIVNPEMDIKIEEGNDDTYDYGYSNTEYADANIEVFKNDNTEDNKINIEYELNYYSANQNPATQGTEMLTECLKKEKTVTTHSKIRPKKNLDKQKSLVSKAQIKQKNDIKEENINVPGYPKSEPIIRDKSVTGAVNACQNCKSTFKTEMNLRHHLQTKHSIFSCQICTEIFASKEALKMHEPIHIKHECDKCGKVFTTKSGLTLHKNQHTREKIFTCDMCNKDFLSRCVLKKHIDFHLGKNKKVMCDLCGHKFNDLTNMKTHIRTVHEKLRLFKCDQCPKKYSTRKTLKIHTRTHTGERPYECQLCDEAFVCTNSLRCHIERIHTNPKYVCNICGKHFSTKARFASHTRTHNIAFKAFKCHHCERQFSSIFALKRHIARHEGTAKMFPCYICHKNFAGKAVMMRHMKNIHDTNKQVVTKTKCNLCKKPVRDMAKHMKTHTGRLLQCEHCPKSYSETSALNRHIREIHCGITHDCNLCDKKYIKANSLRTHQLKKHNAQIQLKVEQDAMEAENENNCLI